MIDFSKSLSCTTICKSIHQIVLVSGFIGQINSSRPDTRHCYDTQMKPVIAAAIVQSFFYAENSRLEL